jgi:hypothetical protein
MAQLRKQDIRQEGDIWVATVTPEAGTVKDKEVREMVLHSKKGEGPRGQLRTVQNRMAEFVREVVKDRRVAPNHAWRHLFKTIGREVGIADSVLDAICGHSPRSIAGSSFHEKSHVADALQFRLDIGAVAT